MIQNAREYSWDYVAGSTWITEKTTTDGAYRAEIQQVVPAPLAADAQARLMAAGRHMAGLVSQDNGAWHNEVFHRANHRTSAVETNMRPGGMHIWDLARKAFIDFDPWERWVRWAVEGQVANHDPVPRGYCGIRLLRASTGGILRDVSDIPSLARSLNIELVEAVLTKHIGDSVSALVKDNFRSSATSCCSTSDTRTSARTCRGWPRPLNQVSGSPAWPHRQGLWVESWNKQRRSMFLQY